MGGGGGEGHSPTGEGRSVLTPGEPDGLSWPTGTTWPLCVTESFCASVFSSVKRRLLSAYYRGLPWGIHVMLPVNAQHSAGQLVLTPYACCDCEQSSSAPPDAQTGAWRVSRHLCCSQSTGPARPWEGFWWLDEACACIMFGHTSLIKKRTS